MMKVVVRAGVLVILSNSYSFCLEVFFDVDYFSADKLVTGSVNI